MCTKLVLFAKDYTRMCGQQNIKLLSDVLYVVGEWETPLIKI